MEALRKNTTARPILGLRLPRDDEIAIVQRCNTRIVFALWREGIDLKWLARFGSIRMEDLPKDIRVYRVPLRPRNNEITVTQQRGARCAFEPA